MDNTIILKVRFILYSEKNNKSYLSQDIWNDSKMDVLDVFLNTELQSTDQNTKIKSETFSIEEMSELAMVIETRPRYPSNKLTLTIANITRDKPIRFFNIFLSLNGRIDVDVVLESSQRNLMSSLSRFINCY